jgi:ornithine cyclodeaminase/alanine dehydrogenase-like protein (mu-crystallin family)
MSSDAPLYLNADHVDRLLAPGVIYQIVEQALQSLAAGQVRNGAKGGLSIDDENGRRFMGAISGALLDRAVAGVKWFATCDENPKRGLPRVPATILLNDAVTGQLRGVIEATSLTALRTAALAAVSVRYCQAARIGKAAIIGFGAIGQALPCYLAANPNVAAICVSGRNFEKIKADCATVGRHLDMSITAEPVVEAAVREADIVITATGLKEDAPFLCGAWLKPGATICALGSYQEIDDAVIERAGRIFVDNWEAGQHRGNLAPFVRAKRIGRAEIAGDIADVVAGKQPGRVTSDEIVLITLIGIGALDIALAAHALEAARQAGLGLPLR